MKIKFGVLMFVLSVGLGLGQVGFAGESLDVERAEQSIGSARPTFGITETGAGEWLAVLDQGDKVRVMYLVQNGGGNLEVAVDVTVADGDGVTLSVSPDALVRSAGISEPMAGGGGGGSASCSSGGNAICCAFTVENRARMIFICWNGSKWNKCFDSEWLAAL